ncbi:ModD protein [Geomesophilobacter sediminis]|uniref:Putative pyrophosphorylase ModD n=1 Tax=Geomesophilobacter sediminis TaxID=2798584 RepID=A0A8J7IQR8_9BACT|nr:ModD protein [Geomesophilobacter sediminis]MBJ6725059.1 ModD protein [Geomesophilobacter sediminis]
MLHCLPDSDIERFLEEDVPYGDLTTTLLGIGDRPGSLTFTTREETTLCCCEEAARLLEKCGASVVRCTPSGTRLPPGREFLVAHGSARALHHGWKVALNLLEYASGIATRTRRLVDNARAANPSICVVTTRKSFPGAKKVSIKAIVAGRALPHRLGLSESILVFKQHTAFVGGLAVFLESVDTLRRQAPEQRIIVEAESMAEALAIAGSGADIVQLDKLSPAELAGLVPQIRAINPAIKISAAGGVNEGNIGSYAAAGVDLIVLSSVYFGKPADIAASMTPSETP